MFKKWINVLVKPVETFRKEKNNSDSAEAVKMLAAAGVIAGIIYAVGFTFFDLPMLSFGSHGPGERALYGLVMILFMPLSAIIHVFMLSVLLYLFANFSGRKVNLTTQTYLIALFASPLMIIYMSAFILPCGAVIAVITIMYFIYLLILVLRETHRQ